MEFESAMMTNNSPRIRAAAAGRALPILYCLALPLCGGAATEYFVSTSGSDANCGVQRATAFATIQRGVDALAPGDTLTVLPGEYFGPVRRDGLGGTGAVTTIRAAIPGTVVLRGDVPLGAFRRAEGRRFAYVTDLGCTGAVVVVNEVDTLRILDRVPNLAELDFMPGVMHHDPAAGKLYITTPDLQPPDPHRYTASLAGTHGLYLSHARRVVVEGLAATGFNARGEISGSEQSLSSVWGLFLANGKECVIRDCRAWLNGQGIGTSSQAETSGDNVIERCTAWANATRFGVGDRGGLTLIDPRRDTIRDSQAFLNGEYGINIRRGGPAELEERDKSLLLNNLAWGNLCDFKIKSGYSNRNEIVRCIGTPDPECAACPVEPGAPRQGRVQRTRLCFTRRPSSMRRRIRTRSTATTGCRPPRASGARVPTERTAARTPSRPTSSTCGRAATTPPPGFPCRKPGGRRHAPCATSSPATRSTCCRASTKATWRFPGRPR